MSGARLRRGGIMATRRQTLITGLLVLFGIRPQRTAEAAPVTGRESAMRLSTYILFDGNCQSAMEFYRTVFGGTLTLTTVGDSPMKAAFPATMHQKVVNARLKSDTVDISASDWLRPSETQVKGNTVCLYLSGGTPAEAKAFFLALSPGAIVTDPIVAQPYGVYGALEDRFGVRWMFHANA